MHTTPIILLLLVCAINKSAAFSSHTFHINKNVVIPRNQWRGFGTVVKTVRSVRNHFHMSSTPGDKLRDSTGKRPSLNPTIINAISEALLLRSSDHKNLPMEVTSDVEPLEVAIAAGKLASNAIEKRAKSSTAVAGDEGSAFTEEECQLIAGRIVGVVMRWAEMESYLIDSVKNTSWVMKYNEHPSFGVLAEECEEGGCDDKLLKQRLKDDPLLRMCRAECLYALFLKNVEKPTMEKIGNTALDSAEIDFLDADRSEVLV